MANMVEEILLGLGVSQEGIKTFNTAADGVKNLGESLLNTLGQYEKITEVQQVFERASTRAFSETIELGSSLLKNVKSITGNFSTMNVAFNAVSVAAKAANYTFSQTLNVWQKMGELGATSIGKTLLQLYAGYKVLSAVVGTTLQVCNRLS